MTKHESMKRCGSSCGYDARSSSFRTWPPVESTSSLIRNRSQRVPSVRRSPTSDLVMARRAVGKSGVRQGQAAVEHSTPPGRCGGLIADRTRPSQANRGHTPSPRRRTRRVTLAIAGRLPQRGGRRATCVWAPNSHGDDRKVAFALVRAGQLRATALVALRSSGADTPDRSLSVHAWLVKCDSGFDGWTA
jgi:hypothetical protein